MAKFHSFFMAEYYSIVYMYHIFFNHSSVDGHLGCFQILAAVSNAVMNIEVHVSFHISAFIFFGYIPRSGIAGSYCSSIFHFFQKPPYYFPQWLPQFTFPPTAYWDSNSITSLQHLLLPAILLQSFYWGESGIWFS